MPGRLRRRFLISVHICEGNVPTLTRKQQLDQLKVMTVRLGVIHEFQAAQLKFWPLLVSDDITSAEIKVLTDDKMVRFYCSAVKFRKTKCVTKMCEAVTLWVREILWNETSIEFYVNNALIYRSDDVGQKQPDSTN